MSKEMRDMINKVKNFKHTVNESIENSYIKPNIIYHGGNCNNLKLLYNKFEILSSEEKMKYISTGGGNFGLSTTVEKSIAKKYSSVFGCKYVLSIKVKQNAKFLFIDTEGKGIDELYTYNELEKLSNDYDAVIEIDEGAEREVRILKPDNFEIIQIEV